MGICYQISVWGAVAPALKLFAAQLRAGNRRAIRRVRVAFDRC